MDKEKREELEALLAQSSTNLTVLGKERIEELQGDLGEYE